MDTLSMSEAREASYRDRLPDSLDQLAGPNHGIVQLPLHIAWSGLTAFDVDRPPLRMSMYQVVPTEGLSDDLTAYLNHHHLVSQWPVLRTILSPPVRRAWESAFPELSERQSASS
jgi:hypothetical protein